MSEPREVDAVVGAPSPSAMNETKEQRKARIASILDRGMTNARLTVKLPDDVYGEWVSRDPIEIDRMRGLGFEIDTKYAIGRSMHGNEGQAIVGDVVFMVAPIEVKEIIDEVRAEQYKRRHGVPDKDGIRRHQLEERNHGENSIDNPHVKIVDEGESANATSAAIAAALKPQTGE